MANPFKTNNQFLNICTNTLVAITLSGILFAKQKLGVTFNSDKQDVIFEMFKNDNLCAGPQKQIYKSNNKSSHCFLGKKFIKGCFFLSLICKLKEI